MTASRLCALADLPEGEAKTFVVDGVELAAARSGTKVFVVENRCSHDDGPLGEGVAVLAFDEDGQGWTVVDFKTDRDLRRGVEIYRRQVGLYAEAIAKATGRPARGVLMHL